MPSSFDDRVKELIVEWVDDTLKDVISKDVGTPASLELPSLLEKQAVALAMGCDNCGKDGYHLMHRDLTDEGRICREFLY